MSEEVVDAWRGRFAELRSVWGAIADAAQSREQANVEAWSGHLEQMQATQQELVTRGAWRGGPRTLLAALGVQYKEVPLTAGLAWLLRPDGHHGLGSSVLDGVLALLRPDTQSAAAASRARVVLEETRVDIDGDVARADLVVYGPKWTVVVEAKVFAVEQERQLDRLFALWGDEPDPTFVFLTRGTRAPTTAEASDGRWQQVTWEQVADIVSAAVRTPAGVAPGVHDYLATLESYHRV